MIDLDTSLVPQCGHTGIPSVLPFVIGFGLANARLDIKIKESANS